MQYLHIYYNFCHNHYILYRLTNDMNTSILKNQKYQTCVDACNKCAECCEACGIECMSNTEMAGMIGKSMMMCRDCADMCRMASMMMARGSSHENKCAICVRIYVNHVQWNVKRWVEKWKYVKQCADMCRMCAQECRKMMR